MHDQPPRQLDIFADSRDVILRNDAIDALLRRDAAGAAAAREALAEHEPAHESLPALDALMAALTAPPAPAFASPTEAAAARTHLEQQLAPAAQAVLGNAAAGWLRPAWRTLAQRAAALPFDATATEAHAAPLWLRAGEPAAAAEAVERIASWQRIPAPLAWMIEARYRADGLDAVWPQLVALAWLAPPRFSQVARVLGDPLLERLRRRFDAEFEPDPTDSADPRAWFPAWLINHQPALQPRLRLAQPGADTPAERCFWLIGELLGLERQGRHHELVDKRRRLRGLQPALYAAYMSTR